MIQYKKLYCFAVFFCAFFGEKKFAKKNLNFFLRVTGCVNVKEYNGEGRRKTGKGFAEWHTLWKNQNA